MDEESLQLFLDAFRRIADALESQNQHRIEFANSVEITNDNAKGETRVTIKGRSDKPLSELVKEVTDEFRSAAK